MALSRAGWVLSSSNNTAALSKAVNGDFSTYWNTYGIQTPGQWFQVDLGAARSFSQIVMDHTATTNDFPRTF